MDFLAGGLFSLCLCGIFNLACGQAMPGGGDASVIPWINEGC